MRTTRCPGVRCYSMYPSRRQRFRDEDVRVFPLDHDIPICESVSPVSSYRWHSMSEAEVAAYRQRLTDEVAELDGRDRGGDRRPIRPRDRPPRVHEHGGAARRHPAPGRGRAGHDAAAVLRARHRAEDVRQRAARRRAGGVPAAVPAVHAAREDLRLRRPGPRRRRRRGDLGRAGRGAARRVPRVPARAGGALPQRLQPGRLPPLPSPTCTPTGREVLAGFRTQPLEGSGRAPEPVAPAGRVRRGRGVLRQVRRLEAAGRAAARGGDLRAARDRRSSPW